MKYIVYVKWKQAPKKIYDDYDDACNEANRLCKQERRDTYVCQILDLYKIKEEVLITNFDLWTTRHFSN